MEEEKLYIPANIKTRLEFYRGYGVKEFIITILVAIISLPFCFLISSIKSTTIAVVVFFIIVATAVISLTKDENNLCVANQVKFLINKLRMQKKYKYRYYDKRRGGFEERKG